ncbi:DUF6924 domain-containing protein [Nakamurella alba]|uniref:DUF6924 domain-containing protein n=1 Tax=Nakamurella alba TaxID=2665158 RepID=UPI003899492B
MQVIDDGTDTAPGSTPELSPELQEQLELARCELEWDRCELIDGTAVPEPGASSIVAPPPSEVGPLGAIGNGADLVRTSFDTGTDAAFDAVCAESLAPRSADGDDPTPSVAGIECVDDPANEGMTAADLVRGAEESFSTFVVIADRITLTDPSHPVLVVDLAEEPGRAFRAAPAMLWDLDANLSIGNMWFSEFADAADASPGGVLRDLG